MKPTALLLALLAFVIQGLGCVRAATHIKIGFPLEVSLGLRSTVELEFQTEPGKIYQVQVSKDLNIWSDVGYTILGTGGPRIFVTPTWDQNRLFFRVRDNGDPNRLLSGSSLGPIGPSGPPGPQGPQGPQGPPGQSADGEARVINVMSPAFGAAGNGQIASNTNVGSGSSILTGPGVFTAADVGKYIRVEGAGPSGFDLVTSISSFQSSSQVTLADSAATAVTNASAIFGRDDTAAIQAAIDAAATSAHTRTVFFPSGVYICNVKLTFGIHLLGVPSSGFAFNGGSVVSDRKKYPVVLMPAKSTLPVIRGDFLAPLGEASGIEIEHLCIVGSKSRQGYGIKLGQDEGLRGWTVHGVRLHRVHINGFSVGLHINNAVHSEVDFCTSTDTDTAFFLACDGTRVSNCETSGNITTFKIRGGKNCVIETGNYNASENFIDVKDTAVSILSINVEYCSGELIKLAGHASLNIDFIKTLGTPTSFISNYGPNWAQSSDISVSHVLGGSSVYKTIAGDVYLPDKLPEGFVIEQYTDTTWTKLVGRRLASSLQGTKQYPPGETTISESWGGHDSSPYGMLGWKFTNIGGTPPTVNNVGPNDMEYMLRDNTNDNRIYCNKKVYLDIDFSSSWRVFPLAADVRMWFGFFEHNHSGVTPKNGIGLRFDPDAADSTWKLVRIANSTVTHAADTGIPLSALAYKTVVIERTSSQFIATIYHYHTPIGTATISDTGVAFSSLSTVPAIHTSTSAGAWRNVKFQFFKLKTIDRP